MASRFSRQVFYDVANRRCAEARILLEAPRAWESVMEEALPLRIWHCDGAVTYALLAVECALKATLLHGHGANDQTDLPSGVSEDLFDSSRGHSILVLWDRQATRIKNTADTELTKSIYKLSGLDPYQHRYGGKRPETKHAQPFVKCCEVVVLWMKEVFQP